MKGFSARKKLIKMRKRISLLLEEDILLSQTTLAYTYKMLSVGENFIIYKLMIEINDNPHREI